MTSIDLQLYDIKIIGVNLVIRHLKKIASIKKVSPWCLNLLKVMKIDEIKEDNYMT